MPDTYAQSGFWAAYQEYADASAPKHRAAARALLPNATFVPQVLDLGCGETQIARSLWHPENYIGLDLHATRADHKADITDFEQVRPFLMQQETRLVVSLFALDVILPDPDTYINQIFSAASTVGYVLTSGFYYTDRRHENPTEERLPDGTALTSYQTLAPPKPLEYATQQQLHFPNPSKLFGPNVIEVWRLFTRSDYARA